MNSKKLVLVRNFNPKNVDEERCLEMAEELGLEYINPILALYHKHGIDSLEKSFEIVTEKIFSGAKIDNKGAYLWRVVEYVSGERDKAEYFRDLYY